jgi:TRAP-type C4-dicarboxylate transport system permease small subunit
MEPAGGFMNPRLEKSLNLLASIVSFSMCLSMLMNSAEGATLEHGVPAPALQWLLYVAVAIAMIASWGAIHHFANAILANDAQDAADGRKR